jgi:uncharacterized protein YjiS (DUF1127 family)
MESIDNATRFSAVTQPARRRGWLRVVLVFIRAGIRAIRSRRELIGMDDHMRADIGISRGEALMESRRHFWDLHTPPDATRRPRGY